MGYTLAHLANVSLRGLCAAVGTSERSLRRAFHAETGMSWHQYLLHARLLRAMATLALPGPSVLEIATAVGFQSLSGFTRAFRRYRARRHWPTAASNARQVTDQPALVSWRRTSAATRAPSHGGPPAV